MKHIGKPFPPVWFVILSLIFALIYTSVKNRTNALSGNKAGPGEYRYKQPQAGNAKKLPSQQIEGAK